MGNVFCFNGFNSFMWFNMDKITKNDRCLIKTIDLPCLPDINENLAHARQKAKDNNRPIQVPLIKFSRLTLF